MNPKQEFVKAIMQVLRLEANLYTMGAIESIIERLEVKDYTMFIAFLGERASDYEKPIQSIAKGVEEFYTIKIEPMERAYDTKARGVSTMVYAYVDTPLAFVSIDYGLCLCCRTRAQWHGRL